jgi:hypothetical protein
LQFPERRTVPLPDWGDATPKLVIYEPSTKPKSDGEIVWSKPSEDIWLAKFSGKYHFLSPSDLDGMWEHRIGSTENYEDATPLGVYKSFEEARDEALSWRK